MSYDLHGTWDIPNKWTGPWLNAHTNLTELRDSMDLFWRNDISPSKIVFGTAFYGRAFTVSNPSCMAPGCHYTSGAPAQPCSREVSVILNSEIMDVIEETGVEPVLHEKETVKSISWGNNWVAYDDEETLAMRADFVREQCLGGIMVWAVSHDTPDAKFSAAIKKAANRPVAMGSSTDGYDVHTTINHQCKWTNCMEGCPSGWHHVRRGDGDARDGEVMANGQGCEGYGTRWLCCPPGASGYDGPLCGWWGHNNGDCDHTDTGSVPVFEIGSNNQYCKKKNAYQVAGCTWSSDAVKAHVACDWSYEFANCDDGSCSSGQSEFFSSSSGSQGAFCDGDSRRKYCCYDSQEDLHWENCAWSENAGITPSNLRSGTCIGGCPDGKTPLALDHKGGSCSRGARAQCCDVGYKTTEKRYNDEDSEFDYYLNYFIEKGAECTPDNDGNMQLYVAQEYIEQKVKKIVYGSVDVSTTDVWKTRIGLHYEHLGIGDLRNFAQTNTAAFRLGSSRLPRRLTCGLTTFNNLIGGKSGLQCTCKGASCCISELCERDGDDTLRRREADDDDQIDHWLALEEHEPRQVSSTSNRSSELESVNDNDDMFVVFAKKRPFTISETDVNGLVVNFIVYALAVCTSSYSTFSHMVFWLLTSCSTIILVAFPRATAFGEEPLGSALRVVGTTTSSVCWELAQATTRTS